jgi:hypothetical protein
MSGSATLTISVQENHEQAESRGDQRNALRTSMRGRFPFLGIRAPYRPETYLKFAPEAMPAFVAAGGRSRSHLE